MLARRTNIVRVVASALLLASAISAQTQGQDSQRDLEDAVIERLHATLVDAEYDAVDLEDVIEDLRQKYDLNIHVSWKRLDAIGVRKDERIELTLKQVPLAMVLRMVLQEALDDDIDQLDYSVRGGIIVISSRNALQRDTILKTYDITDLIESGYAVRRFANTPVLGMVLTGREYVGGEKKREPATGGGGGGGGGSGGGIFGDPSDDSNRIGRMELVNEVVTILQEHIEPDSWRDSGGDTGSITIFESTLLILHTIEIHLKIKVLLDMLRLCKPESLDSEAIILRLRNDKASELRREIGESFPRISETQFHALVEDEESGTILFRAASTGHNGEAIWFSALTQRDVLVGMIAKLNEHAVAYDPVTGVVTEGLELIVLPLLDPDGENVSLDVQMAWVPTSSIAKRDVSLALADEDASIDQVTRSMRTVSATAKLRLDQGLVLTIPNHLDATGRAAEYEDWLIIRTCRPQ